jgi:hypothetical protein
MFLREAYTLQRIWPFKKATPVQVMFEMSEEVSCKPVSERRWAQGNGLRRPNTAVGRF